jgi:hypothetical protein
MNNNDHIYIRVKGLRTEILRILGDVEEFF